MITPRVNSDKQCDPKVATKRKTKWRHGRDNLHWPNCDSDGKAENKRTKGGLANLTPV